MSLRESALSWLEKPSIATSEHWHRVEPLPPGSIAIGGEDCLALRLVQEITTTRHVEVKLPTGQWTRIDPSIL